MCPWEDAEKIGPEELTLKGFADNYSFNYSYVNNYL